MSWRTIIISRRAKLDYKANHLVIRAGEEVRIHISEIAIVIIEDTAVSLTVYLLAELIKAKVKIIFCDDKRNPTSELLAYYGSHDTSSKIRQQIAWSMANKLLIWTEIVAEKIRKQAHLLRHLELDKDELLMGYLLDLKIGDTTNREAHAAKVYFNKLFGLSFTRTEDNATNAALNYGYTILLSAFNREVTALGYLTQVGIFHDNQFNPFNLSSDLMEPFRPLVDQLVFQLAPTELDQNTKYQLTDILNQKVVMANQKIFVSHAIKVYVKSVLEAVTSGDIADIKFYNYEL